MIIPQGWPSKLLVLCGLLTSLAALAGPVPAHALTLDEALALAAVQSPRVQAAYAGSEAAGAQASALSWARLPRVEARLESRRTDHPAIVFSDLLAQERFTSADLGSLDPVQGTLDPSTLNRPDPLTNFRAAVSLRQPLWTGGATTSRLKAGRSRADASRSMARRTLEEVVFQTEEVFRRAMLADERLDLVRGTLSVARAQAARVESLWTAGLALQSDRRALEAHVLESEAALAGAEADSVEARSLLGWLLGAGGPVRDPLEIPDPQHGLTVPGLTEALSAVEDRGDVRAAESKWQGAEAGKGMAWSEGLPALELLASAEHNSHEFLGEGGDQWMVGVVASWRLDAGLPSRTRAAAAQARAAKRQLETARERARHEVVVAHTHLRSGHRRTQALEAAASASEASFALVLRRHQEGLATTLELIESQNTLTRTQLMAASARHDWALAQKAFLLRAGLLPLPEISR
jgi:outer membrane protein TolC